MGRNCRKLWCGVAAWSACLAFGLNEPALAEQAPEAKTEDQTIRMEVPLYRDVTIDGDADDWQGRGHAEASLEAPSTIKLDQEDLSAQMRIGWDEQGLALLISVQDDYAAESADHASILEMDCIEMMISDESTDGSKIRFAISPGRATPDEGARVRTWDYREDIALRRVPIDMQTACRHDEAGYVIEVLIPWNALGLVPQAGAEIGFSVEVHDADAGHRRDRLRWGPIDRKRSMGDPPTLNRLILAPMLHALAALDKGTPDRTGS